MGIFQQNSNKFEILISSFKEISHISFSNGTFKLPHNGAINNED